MATTVLVVGQLGSYTPATGVWGDAFGNIVTLGGGVQAWAQLPKAVPLVNTVSAFTATFAPNFTESGTLTVLARSVPTTATYSTVAGGPTSQVAVGTQTVAFAGVPIVLTVPLVDAASKATRLLGDMRARERIHAVGVHRFSVGFEFSGSGGVCGISTFTLTHADEFTGWGARKPALGDRAVRCPRCGTVTTERSLVRDGIIGLEVCSECYDPPREAPNWVRLRGTPGGS